MDCFEELQPRDPAGAPEINFALFKPERENVLPPANHGGVCWGNQKVGLKPIEVISHIILSVPALYAKSLISREDCFNFPKSHLPLMQLDFLP